MVKVKRDLYQEVTDNIIDALERGVKPWVCPWDKSGLFTLPVNHYSGDYYHGINVCLLWIAQEKGFFSSSRWMTYKQAKEKGGQVKKGEKGTTVIFYKTLEKETGKVDSTGHDVVEKIPMLRCFTVFNLDQIDGIELPVCNTSGDGFDAIQRCEDVLIASGVPIHERGQQAFYDLRVDSITMPERSYFFNANDYYASVLHELTHATRHPRRCDREPYATELKDGAYGFEELVAEIGANYCMAWLGLAGNLHNHASYIDYWLQVLKNDKRFIFKAAAQAQKAHEWIEQQTKVFYKNKAA